MMSNDDAYRAGLALAEQQFGEVIEKPCSGCCASSGSTRRASGSRDE